MFDKLLIAVFCAIVLFVIWSYITYTNKPVEENLAMPYMPAYAPPTEQQVRIEPTRTVSPGGPNPPNAASTEEDESSSPEVNPKDPYDDTNSSGNLKDNLRHPERMFSPGIKNTDTSIQVYSGVASPGTQGTSQALQTFAPEAAQNGGEFMHGIAANDTMSNTEFAAF